jgi:mRNA interferase MazF
VLPVASTRIDAPFIRLDVLPTSGNGLRAPSQVMIDKAMTLRRERIGAAFGQADDQLILKVGRLLAVFLGIAR